MRVVAALTSVSVAGITMMIEGVVLALVIVVGEVAVLSREVVVPLRE